LSNFSSFGITKPISPLCIYLLFSGIVAVSPNKPDTCSVNGVIMSPFFKIYCCFTSPLKYVSSFDVFSLNPYPG